MNPQGNSIVNVPQFEKMLERVNNVNSCEQLQRVTDDLLESLYAQLKAVTDQMEKVAPILALLEAPTSPSDVITWIADFIENILHPLYAPMLTYPTQLATQGVQITTLIAAILSKASEFTSCSIDVPSP